MDMGLILGSAQYNVHSFGLDEFFCLTPNMNTTSKFSPRGRILEPRSDRFHRGQTWSLTVSIERICGELKERFQFPRRLLATSSPPHPGKLDSHFSPNHIVS